jgi:hypothetical protein
MYWTDPQTQVEQEGGRIALPDGMQLGRLVYQGNDMSAETWQITFYEDGTAEESGFELRDQDRYVSVNVTGSGRITMTKDALPEPTDVRWSAGDNEVRQ